MADAQKVADKAPDAKAPPAERYVLVRGSTNSPKGKWRGAVEAAPGGAMMPDTTSIFWPPKKSQDVILTESALRECQGDSEISVIVVREASEDEFREFMRGQAVAAELVSALSDAPTDALERELSRRRQVEAAGKKAGRS